MDEQPDTAQAVFNTVNTTMETMIYAGKIGSWIAGSAVFAIVIDATTNVPLVWLIVGIGGLAGGVWKLATLLTRIDDRLNALERRNEEKDARDAARSHGD